MDFAIDKHSALPASAQIVQQIKYALLLGRLRPGDTLPSIRDVEKQTGLGRNIVHKAYLDLRTSGILDLRHGKGVLVAPDLRYGLGLQLEEKCDDIARGVLTRLRAIGVSPSSFGRYFQQQASLDETRRPFIVYVDMTPGLAQQRAEIISTMWQTTVPGFTIEELAEGRRGAGRGARKILTNYIRYDQVLAAVGKSGPEVIPLGLRFAPEIVEEFKALPPKASVALIRDDRDSTALTETINLFRDFLLPASASLRPILFTGLDALWKLIRSGKYDKIVITNWLWEDLPRDLRKHQRVCQPSLTVDLQSLESARIRAGVIV